MRHSPQPIYQNHFPLRTLAFAMLAVVSFSAALEAKTNHLSSLTWTEIQTDNNLSGPSGIAVSPQTHDFVAIASDNDTGDRGVIACYFLDHNNLSQGWQKKQSLGHTSPYPRVFYALDRFIIPLEQWDQRAPYNTIILTSEDNALSWNEITEYTDTLSAQDQVKYIDIGSDDQYYAFELQNTSKEISFVAIGSEDFIGKPLHACGPHEIVAVAGDDEYGWVAVGSDGHSYFGTPKGLVIAPAANQ